MTTGNKFGLIKKMLVLGMTLCVGVAAYGVWRIFLRPRGAEFGPVETIRKVAENLYLIPGAGGNTAVFVTTNGVLLVDTKVSYKGQSLVDQVKAVTDKPVTHIINTHSHGDHTGSNEFFPSSVEIVTHENTLVNMKKMSDFFFGWKKIGLPDRTFMEKLTLFSGKDAVDLYYFGPAHTNGDTFVVFREARVMHSGDVFEKNEIPHVHRANGGSGIGYGDALHRAVTEIKDVDIVIPGHGGVVAWNDFVEFEELTRVLLEASRTAFREGKTPEEAAASLKLPGKFKDYNMSRVAVLFKTVFAEQ